MNAALCGLAARREMLVSRAALERQDLHQQLQPLRRPLAVLDQGIALVVFCRRRPLWLFAGVVLISAIRPTRMGLWLHRAVATLQLVSRL